MHKYQIDKTLELNQNLSLTGIKKRYIEPFFHKIAKKFDEGGYQGLLLNNVNRTGEFIFLLYKNED